jgi:hypothetical protein
MPSATAAGGVRACLHLYTDPATAHLVGDRGAGTEERVKDDFAGFGRVERSANQLLASILKDLGPQTAASSRYRFVT